MKVAFVLPGGSIKSAFQIGCLKELIKRDIEPDCVIGVSGGSVNGSVLLTNNDLKENIKRMESLWKKIKRADVFPINFQLFYKTIYASSIYSNKGLKQILKKMIPRDNFKYLSKKLYILSTDFSNGDPVYFNKGKIIEKVLASCAIPGVYPPIKIKGKYYIDGGLSGNAGIIQAEQLGNDIVFVLNPSTDPPKNEMPSFYLEMMRTIDSSYLNVIEREIRQLKKSKAIEIRASTKFSGKFTDFKQIKNLINDGQKRTKQLLNAFSINSKKDLEKL